MKLSVPMVYQKPHSEDCGLAMLAMLMQYHGEKVRIAELKKEIMSWRGACAAELGLYLLKHDYTVEIITQETNIFTKLDRHRSLTDLEQRLQQRQQKEKDIFKAIQLQSYHSFLSQGGRITVKIPTEHDIRKEIEAGRPLGAQVTTCFLTDKIPEHNSHFNVITGIGKRDIFVQDPDPGVNGGSKKYSIADYMYAIHADKGELLLVRK